MAPRLPPRQTARSTGSRANGDVGYGRPPVASRFKPGQSGNPYGRPKKPKAPPDLLIEGLSEAELQADPFLREAARKIKVQENGKTVHYTAAELAYRSVLQRMIKGGDPQATQVGARLLEDRRKAAVAKRVTKDAEKIRRFVEMFECKVSMTMELLRAERNGFERPQFKIDPSFIVLCEDGSVAFLQSRQSTTEDVEVNTTLEKLLFIRDQAREDVQGTEDDLKNMPEYRDLILQDRRRARRMVKKLAFLDRLEIHPMPGIEGKVLRAAEQRVGFKAKAKTFSMLSPPFS